MALPQIGSPAPSFELLDQDGKPVTLGSLLTQGPVMLAFYPGDFTPTCTKQLCDYRDSYGEFAKQGIQVIGISGDDVGKHGKFREQYGFRFPLLTDPGRKTAKAYGVNTLSILSGLGRAIFVIDREGRIVYAHNELTPFSHQGADEVLGILGELKAQGRI